MLHEVKQRPFLKWAGGKFSSLVRILDMLPKGKRLVEPFAGAGTVFLNAEYDEYLIADVNSDLINLYQILKEHGEDFIKRAEALFTPENNTEAEYYHLREWFNACENRVEKAVLFLYLNRHGYNGLCRYNTSGKFNVPFGRQKCPHFPRQEMRVFLAKAARTRFVCNDFRPIMAATSPGDVVYADPPYVPLSATASFTSYSSGGFIDEDQLVLAKKAKTLACRGVPVLISNHDTEWTRKLYDDSRCSYSEVRRSISCNGVTRKPVREVLALYEQ